ncbi:hypothetical protein MMC30_002675 [Trapelia coarctata]|nr:hypothetical protein [Trapelia coarctata]
MAAEYYRLEGTMMAPANSVKSITPTDTLGPWKAPRSLASRKRHDPTKDTSRPASLESYDGAIAAEFYNGSFDPGTIYRLATRETAVGVSEAARRNFGPDFTVTREETVPRDCVSACTEAQRIISDLERKIGYLKYVKVSRTFLNQGLDEMTRMKVDYQRQIAYLMSLRAREDNVPSDASASETGYNYANRLRETFPRNLNEIKSETGKALEQSAAQGKLVEEENIKLREELGKPLKLEEAVQRYSKRHHREIKKHVRQQENLEQDLEEKETKISDLEARLERQGRELKMLKRGRNRTRKLVTGFSLLFNRAGGRK